jgi:replicative DNA helicase
MQPASQHELSLLAAVLCDPSLLDDLTITGHQFLDQDLGRLLDAIRLLRDTGVPVRDIGSVVPKLRDMRLPESVTSAEFLTELLTRSYEVSAAEYYASEITRRHSLRELLQLSDHIRTEAAGDNADPTKILSWLSSRLHATELPGTHKPELVVEVYDRVADELCNVVHAEQSGILTGIPRHDEEIGGWQPGDLVILAARPGNGKTSLAQQIAWHHASRGRTVGFVSLEMSSEELVQRQIASVTGLDSRDVRRGKLDSRDRVTIKAARDSFEASTLTVWDPPRATTANILSFGKRLQSTGKLDLLVIDYLQLVAPLDQRQKRYEQVTQMSADLKSASKELGCPVLCLAQLNREADGQPPRLRNLRESGSIEQDADIVIFLHPEDERAFRMKVFLIVAKNRHGPTGKFSLEFQKRSTTFVEWQDAVTEKASYDHRLADWSSPQGDEF